MNFDAADSRGNESGAASSISVLDTTGPAVLCNVARLTLWPPNHAMIDVGLTFSAMDPCASGPLSYAVSVSRDEDAAITTGSGGKAHCPDAIVGGDLSVPLRAERSGDRDGRVYVITVSATDSCGNVGICQVLVAVPVSSSPDARRTRAGRALNVRPVAARVQTVGRVPPQKHVPRT